MYVAPTPQPALDTSAFDAFLEQQDIKYDIEIELLRDTYVSANGNMESVHSMAETLGLKVRASSAYDNTPSHQSPYLPRHPSLVEHGLKSSGNGSDAELEIDELDFKSLLKMVDQYPSYVCRTFSSWANLMQIDSSGLSQE